MRRLIIPIVAITLVAAACSGPGAEEVASYRGRTITVDDVSDFFSSDNIQIDNNFRRVAYLLITQDLLEVAYTEDFGASVDEGEVEERMPSISSQIDAQGGLPEFYDIDKVVEFEARQTVLRDGLMEELVAGPGVIDQLLAEFASNPGTFATVCVRHVLSATEEAALDALARIEDGEDLATVATEVSLDSSPGGDLGCASPGLYVAEFAAATLEAEVGVLSGPIETDFGFHVLIVDERTTPTEADLTADPGAYLSSEQLQALWTDWLNTALTEADIVVNEKYGMWDPATLQIVAPTATE